MTHHVKNTHSFSTIFSGYWQLIRPLNAVMSTIGAYIGYLLALHTITFDITILYGMLAVFFISGASQSINDYFDYAIDKQRKSTRPLASGKISRTNGLVFSFILYILGITLASFLNNEAFLIALFFSVLTFLYSSSMSEIKFMGNIIVSISVAFTFIFGASLVGITPLVLMISLAAFLANWAREIIKDVEDVRTDKGHKLTLPLILNTHQTRFIILIILGMAIVSGYLPVYFGLSTIYYTFLVTIANIIFILAGKNITHNRAEKSQSLLKKGMLVALLAQISLLI
ncbi:MAG: hypothetical protein FJY86_02845 [Candidatus Diapherotrites archaeon]|uniref:Geranylgeranylglycerol-phosphate geranylgeranyltransferase n=1 Tax=Candidatus Iainarchaeum sp. TaxID=3101447 RepID=A0A8T4C748_9ARCH|nr:hypothetical protein [Candidatus Diapherotrites archaeon]